MSQPGLDLVGIGFGPSNLAMAIAVAEHNDGVPEGTVAARFLERQPEFGWHRGMLLEDATMQVSFLKDLVTLRNPTSDYSFLRYLHDRNRLVDFINHKTLFPLRVEFHDYFTWAAAKVNEQVSYDTEVISVLPVTDGTGDVRELDVVSRRDGAIVTNRTRNLVIGTGLRPRMPAGVQASERVWHSSDLLRNVGSLHGTAPERLIVVGAGQSAAEAVAFLHEQFPAAEVCAVVSRYGYSPADDSSFANRIFDPNAVDEYFDAPAEVKEAMMAYHANTNYSVVDIDLIQELYRRTYREKVLGRERLRLLNLTRTTSVVENPDGLTVTLQSLVSGERTALEADAVVFATGYDEADPYAVLGELGDLCHRDEQGRPRVGRDYRALTDPRLQCGIYLQGGTEHTHGISSALLSNTAIRVGEVLGSVLERRAASILMAA
ncbi:lysine N(6)-hydroxylase/L-ornithine N(5)-oxygenase family protein [Cryptosporangium phraense]|uniref:L-lysine N6-monooxygenase MbtG n=1 Tax=Cryptosporangium phraense TaxID=2593070 RepID=A0A545AX16_9ACTN|nr:lysine N(6)-hydroxylase/L-ornithine N(5)-oxygenase family protein [Cryptosporangium phraense]TQS45864.1 lysine N(6)-hydroxylase/L-ornithine N(5)-oxygenase family protein [Cryptosporangium phraense]